MGITIECNGKFILVLIDQMYPPPPDVKKLPMFFCFENIRAPPFLTIFYLSKIGRALYETNVALSYKYILSIRKTCKNKYLLHEQL